MVIQRYSLEVDISDSDKANAEFIKFAYDEWIKMKDKLVDIAKKLKDSWEKEESKSEKISYFG